MIDDNSTVCSIFKRYSKFAYFTAVYLTAQYDWLLETKDVSTAEEPQHRYLNETPFQLGQNNQCTILVNTVLRIQIELTLFGHYH